MRERRFASADRNTVRSVPKLVASRAMRRLLLAVGLLLASSLVAVGAASCSADATVKPDAGTPEAGIDSGGMDGAGDVLVLDGGCGGEAGEIEALAYQLPTQTYLNGLGVGVDSAGNAFFTGAYFGAGSVGDAAVPTPAGPDGYVARRNADGSIGWIKTFGGGSLDVAQGLTVDGNGDVYVTGMVNGTVSVFGTIVPGAVGVQSAFVAKLKGADGSPMWVRPFGPSAIGVGLKYAGGRLVVSFTYAGTVMLAPVSADTTVSGQGGAIADLDPATGNANWAKSIAAPDDAGIVTVQGLEHTGTEAVVSGTFSSQNVSVGGASLVRVGSGATGYYVGFDNKGAVTEKADFGVADGGQVYNAVVVRDGKGTGFVLGGTVTGAIDFGGGPVGAQGGGNSDAYLADITNQGSAVAWQKVFGGPSADGVDLLDLDRCGHPVAVVSVGSTPLKVDTKELFTGYMSMSVLKLDPADGTLLRVRGSAPSAPGEVRPRSLAVGANGDLWVAGTLRNSATFGPLPASSVTGFGGFLVHYGP